jgi:putative membrane protein
LSKIQKVGTDPDPRFTLANERTFLAWIRTSMGLILAAVVVSTLLSSLLEFEILAIVLSSLLSFFGAGLGLWAWFRWRSTEVALRLGRSIPRTSVLALLASVTAVFGITMIVVGVVTLVGF